MWRSGYLGLPHRSFPCSPVLAVLMITWAAAPSAAGSTVEEKLLHAEDIIGSFEAGHNTVRVIVNLVKPPKEPGTVRATSLESQSVYSRNVLMLKTYVMSTLPARDVKLRRRFSGLSAFSAEVTAEGIAALLNEPLVESIEPVQYYYPHVAQGIPLMKADTYRPTYNGQGTSIAIIDSGIDYTHPQLGGGKFPNDKVIGGYDTGEEDSDPFPSMSNGDSSGEHGTACAGIAAGNIGGPSPYIGGVAPGAKLYALKNVELGQDGSQRIGGDNTIEAILWCIEHKNDDPDNPIVVISISQGGRAFSSVCDTMASRAEVDACQKAIEAGIAIVASSGNEGRCDSIGAPACYSSVISVGAVYDADIGRNPPMGYVGCLPLESCAGYTEGCGCGRCYADETTKADQVPTYSNTASFLTLLAPSNRAYTTDIAGANGYGPGNYHDNFGGTSAAAPYAAGAVACLQSAAKALTGTYLTPDRVRTILTSTGDSVTDRKVSPPVTKPRINVAKAIEAVMANKGRKLVFEDTFPLVGINSDKWVEYTGATIDEKGLAEPSPSYSLRLNGHPKGNDSIISKALDLSGFIGATLTYWYERTGGGDPPDAGDDLIIEYSVGVGWQEVSRQPGGDPNMTEYRETTIELPAAALQPNFQLRIRSIGLPTASRVFDDWFIDDVMIYAQTKPTDAVLLEDHFESPDLDPGRWARPGRATVDAMGLNEPSPGYSLRLNNCPMAHDSVASAPIDFSPYARATVSYWYQRTGGGEVCDEGEDLIVEYDSGSGWRELRRHRGGEPDMAQYEQVTIDLPADALTANFRLQIRTTGYAVSMFPFYDWFVDDVTITGFAGQ